MNFKQSSLGIMWLNTRAQNVSGIFFNTSGVVKPGESPTMGVTMDIGL